LQFDDGPQSRAVIYHQLGLLALERQQFRQAEQYFWQALKGFVLYSHNYACAYYHLGIAALEQRHFLLAEQHYQHALKGFIMYKDYYKQAGAYHQLGRVAVEQQQFLQSREYFLLALKTFRFYGDKNSGATVLRSCAQLWKVSGDITLPATIAPIIGFSEQETEELFRRVTENEDQ
jgi:tetratricopeptide (TPR) repeat protein